MYPHGILSLLAFRLNSCKSSPVSSNAQNVQRKGTWRVCGCFVCVCVSVSHLAEKRGFELCGGVAGVKKLTKGNLVEVKNREIQVCFIYF